MAGSQKYLPDDIDRQIIAELQKNGRASYKHIARKLDLSDGTIRLRVGKMIAEGLLKITAQVNPLYFENSIAAMICMNLEKRDHRQIMEKIVQMSGVKSVINSTGRYDIVAEVFFHSREELRSFLMEDLHQIGGILSSETFIYLDAIHKWMDFF
jgi:Lrp/AsnC family transcriptional regulator for asnA, asnC and gidA